MAKVWKTPGYRERQAARDAARKETVRQWRTVISDTTFPPLPTAPPPLPPVTETPLLQPKFKTMFKTKAPVERTDRFLNRYPKEWVYVKPDASIRGLACCGVKELDGIQTYHAFYRYELDSSYLVAREFIRIEPWELVQIVKNAYRGEFFGRDRPFIIFTDNHHNPFNEKGNAGQNLLEYILAHKLGQVFRTGRHLNGNSGNEIELFTWVVNWPALLDHTPTGD